MAKIDEEFKALCKQILAKGRPYSNKNRGVERLQIPSYTLRHSFKDGFPILTIKDVPFYSIVGELIWFLRGDTDIKFLNKNGIKIWNKDAYNWYVKKYSNSDPIEGQEEFYHRNEDGSYRMFTEKEFSDRGSGSVGQNYSAQWRNFGANHFFDKETGKYFTVEGVDQIKELIETMKSDIMSSRLKVNAWNPQELDQTALPPCHSEFQVIGVPLSVEDKRWYLDQVMNKLMFNMSDEKIEELWELEKLPEYGFELHWNQRSVDTFLGLPFNIASYGLLAKILEKLTGYPALGIEGTLKCVHFYDNQYSVVDELMKRDPNSAPPVSNVEVPEIKSIDDIYHTEVTDFGIYGYLPQKALKVPMLAPKKL